LEYLGGGTWAPEFLKTNLEEEAFMQYDNYTINGTYSILSDFSGPLYLYPPNC
jgi:hypothetical protein